MCVRTHEAGGPGEEQHIEVAIQRLNHLLDQSAALLVQLRLSQLTPSVG